MGRTDDGQHFFAMELVRGETLDVWLKHHEGIDLKTRLGLFRKLCEAVAYAHQRGAIHRDLKPSNVIVLKESPVPASSPEAGIPDLKILDFGLTRITDRDMTVTTAVSEAGSVRGTLPYMSPEQVRGNPDEIDVRTDVYSLGVILYELLTGQLPYDVRRKSLPEAVRIISEEPPKPLTRSWSGTRKLDVEVSTIAYKALPPGDLDPRGPACVASSDTSPRGARGTAASHGSSRGGGPARGRGGENQAEAEVESAQ